MNIFFRVAYHQPDPVIGNLLAWGALAMGIGLLIGLLLQRAPRLANLPALNLFTGAGCCALVLYTWWLALR